MVSGASPLTSSGLQPLPPSCSLGDAKDILFWFPCHTFPFYSNLPFCTFSVILLPHLSFHFEMPWEAILGIPLHCTVSQRISVHPCGLTCHLSIYADSFLNNFVFMSIKMKHGHVTNQNIQKVYEKNSVPSSLLIHSPTYRKCPLLAIAVLHSVTSRALGSMLTLPFQDVSH